MLLVVGPDKNDQGVVMGVVGDDNNHVDIDVVVGYMEVMVEM